MASLKGAASTVPGPAGKSAYEVAKVAGFAGTEAQWLASLQGAPGAPLRVEQYTATSNSSAVASYAFSSAFVAAPLVLVRSGWSGNQEIGGGITATTTTGCTAAVKRSRGTLLLTDGPFEPAPNTALTVVAIGR
ncbi:hypothetical protein BKE38_05035 [Pseudoroseomonas deserti]|uniref:Uncharacterized protein n=1 Tax=Teichococcus deserti TaxID=1817963 RepID=A0A1V2H6L4_9PROT|nr:hypothetical protein [Pseudoroseomonas deserti]ONG56960.1 hypothetical protein BKE38_05035 [Pseudoroseomonas deserti]